MALALTACGSSGGNEAATVTQTETLPATPGTGSDNTSTDEDFGGSPSDSGGGKITVPDVVGKNHQLAQDTMQAAGLYNLSEEDATGEGRLLIIDRNWKVVSQDPPAGTKVNEDETITLRSKKYTDP